MEALKGVSLAETPRGPIKFDQLNNVIGTIYIRRLGKDGAKYGLKSGTKRSRPTKMSVSSGSGPNRNSWRIRSTHATIRH